MAKTFGTGADPKGLVARGVEGSGAAQIFAPSRAAQDFVTGQRQDAQLKQRQKQTEAKAKADRQKELNKYTVDLVAETFTQADNETALAMFGEIQDELAEFKRLGINPDTQPEFKQKVYKAKQFNNMIKNQRQDYNKALSNLNAISKDANYAPEQIDDFVARLQAYTMASPTERFSIDISSPLKPEKIDWNKGFQSLINNTKLDLTEIEVDDKTVINENVPKERIEANWKNYTATKEYKEQVKVYMSEFGLSEDEASKEAKRNYIAALLKKYREKYDEDSGGINVNYGGNAISSDGVTAFYNPKAYNTAKDRSSADYIAIRAYENKPNATLEDKVVSAEGAIMFKPSKGRPEIGYRETATEGGNLILFRPNAIYKRGKGYVAFGRQKIEVFETKKDSLGNAYQVKVVKEVPRYIEIGNNNRIEIENTWLAGEDIDAAFANFKANRKSAQPTQQSAPTQSATTKPATQRKPLGSFITK